jgi:MFS family permease
LGVAGGPRDAFEFPGKEEVVYSITACEYHVSLAPGILHVCSKHFKYCGLHKALLTYPKPGVSFMDTEFNNTSQMLSALTVSIFVLGYVIGPLILAVSLSPHLSTSADITQQPLSEIYGRRIVLTGANIFFCVWQIGCALAPNINALIVFRFLAGIGGSGCLTIGGGVIADLFHADRRGLATSIYSVGPL